MSKRYNTPHRTHIIKTRVTEEEHADFMERLTAYGMSLDKADSSFGYMKLHIYKQIHCTMRRSIWQAHENMKKILRNILHVIDKLDKLAYNFHELVIFTQRCPV